MTVVLDRPYQFVPPHRGSLWPRLIQAFRLCDRYLARKEGVVGYQCRGLEHWEASQRAGKGILLAPNHCRYADPLVMGWPARDLKTHLFAMASWHLFAESDFDKFAISKMGGFSINREGSDRQSLDTAIDALVTATRPLVLFPEGTTNRTNDVLKPLLDGVSFIARTAARRRSKQDGGEVVMHPVALKYLCVGDVSDWANKQLLEFEQRFGWTRSPRDSILDRTIRLAEAMLSLKEIEHLGMSSTGSLPERRDVLIEQLLAQAESNLSIDVDADGDVRDRVRAIRSEVVSQCFADSGDKPDIDNLKADAARAELAQELASYPDCYLMTDQATDTRIVETIQRMQERLLGKADSSVPLEVVIEVDRAIRIPASKAPRGEEDPVMNQLHESLQSMLARLSSEARGATEAGLA